MSLRPPLKDRLVSPMDASSVARIRAGVVTRDRRPSRRRWLLAVAGAAAVAAVGVLAWKAPPSGEPLTVDGRSLAPLEVEAPHALTLDDGSRIELHAGTRLVPRSNDGRELVLDLERGEIELDVVPDTGRRWMIEARWATIEVVGTRFAVARDERGVDVSVQRGEVVVRGEHVLGRVRHLLAGQRLRVLAPEPIAVREPEVLAADPPEDEPQPLDTTEAPVDEVSRTDALEPRAPSRARSIPEPAPVDEVAALLASADAARAAGRPREAADHLAALVAEHRGDRRAPLAAFTLARLQLDVLGEPAAALETLEHAIVLGLPAPVVLDAHARRIEALARSGRSEDARAAAVRFEAEHPESPRLPEVRRWGRLDAP